MNDGHLICRLSLVIIVFVPLSEFILRPFEIHNSNNLNELCGCVRAFESDFSNESQPYYDNKRFPG